MDSLNYMCERRVGRGEALRRTLRDSHLPSNCQPTELPVTYLKLPAKMKNKTKKGRKLSFNLLPSEKISIIQPSFSTVLPVLNL